MKIKFKVHYWPTLFAVWIFAGFLVSYIVAVTTDDIAFVPFIPYISEMGAWLPSSCVFGQVMNITAVLSAILLYLRYRQIDLAISTNTTELNKRWNDLEFWLGFVVAFGLSIVGNFQGNMSGNVGVLVLHLIGSSMAFGIGGIYLAIQIKISFDLRPYYERYPQFGVSKFIQYLRLLSTLVLFLNLPMVVGFALATPRESNGYRIQGLFPGEDGYDFRIISVLSEWTLMFIFLFNVLSMTKEFKVLEFDGIHFKGINKNVIDI